MFCFRNFFACNPFCSRTSIVQKIIEIDPCQNILDTEFTLDFCPRCNYRNRQNSNYQLMNHCNAANRQHNSHNNCNVSEKEFTIKPCTPYVEEPIELNVENGKLLHIKINLLHVRFNWRLKIGVLLCQNNTPYAFKLQQICLRPTYCYCRKHRRCMKCACTAVDFDFLIADEIDQNLLQLKIITQYGCW